MFICEVDYGFQKREAERVVQRIAGVTSGSLAGLVQPTTGVALVAGPLPNTSRHELTTAMRHLCLRPLRVQPSRAGALIHSLF